jgi:peptide/nickel transport system substrate-binding protein
MAGISWFNGRRRISRRRVLTAGATLSGAAFLAACGGGDDTPSGGTGGATSGAASPAAGAQATGTQAAAAGKRGGTMRLSKAGVDTGLDPAITVTNPLHPAKAFSHTHVYRVSSDEVLLDLATSYEQTDPTTLVFKLREGVAFQDAPPMNGRAMTSEDLAFSFSRFPTALKEYGSQVNRIVWGWMDKFETPDKQTLVIKQGYPWASNIAAMGSAQFGIVAREAVEANGGRLDNVLVAGSGPYTLTKRDSTGTKYVRNAKYYRHSNPAPTFVKDGPYIDSWEEAIIPDGASVKAKFLAGELDMLNTSQLPVDKLVADELGRASGVVVVKQPANTHLIMAFDNVKWTDKRLREAVSLAIDREGMIKNLYLGDGLYGGPVSPGFTKLALSQDELKKAQQYDPKKARDLWTAAGGNSVFPTIKMVAHGTIPLYATSTEFVAENLRKNLGANVSIDTVDGSTFVARAVAAQKDWELLIAGEGTLASIPDYNALTHYVPEGYGGIFPNFKKESAKPEVAAMAAEVSRLNAAQASALEPQDRKAKMDALQRYVLENFAPVLGLPIQGTVYAAHRSWVKNFPVDDFQYGVAGAGPFRVHNIYLDR